ncbi:hypothetical protein [Mycolicibacterium sphagni]|nr:hypothetical protein [Mycolicibacterium sphagni]
MGLLGGGLATGSGDPDLSGETYAKASQDIKSWGGKAEIGTVIGDQVATDDCIVTRSRRPGYLNSSGTKDTTEYVLDLFCGTTLAAPGKPGNSAASPQGKQEQHNLKAIEWINQDPKNCAGQTWCKPLCDKYPGKCSQDVLDYLAANS